MLINDLLKIAVDRNASDLHLKVGVHPVIRVDGALIPLAELRPLMQEEAVAMAFSIMSARQKEKFKNNFEIDIAYSVPSLGRFRCNIFQQRGTVGLVLRVIPQTIRTIRELVLPPVIEKICQEQRGLVLCTGTTGSGKSTTLAAMIDLINREQAVHIITIEDPIEYVHRHQRAMVVQREVGSDTLDFARGLRAALREDPDVVLVGEMRDLETVTATLTLAETGHLVFATLHTNDTAQAIDRMIDVFPTGQQRQVQLQLSQTLLAVLHQRLLPRADGTRRIAAFEVMVATPAVRNLIKEGKTNQLRNVVATGAAAGMRTLEADLRRLVQEGAISSAVAGRATLRPEEVMV